METGRGVKSGRGGAWKSGEGKRTSSENTFQDRATAASSAIGLSCYLSQ